MSRVAFTCLLKQKLKFCSSLTHIFDEKKVSIFFKNKPVWRIFSPGFMFSEMNLWKFRHYFWQFRHYFWKLDFSSTLMLKLMETLFFKLLCRTPDSGYFNLYICILFGSPCHSKFGPHCMWQLCLCRPGNCMDLLEKIGPYLSGC